MRKNGGNILVTLGAFLAVYSGLMYWQSSSSHVVTLSLDDDKAYNYETHSNYPRRLIIKSAGIDVLISPAEINDRVWSYSDRGVSYLITTPLPGEMGNSVIYGHNWNSILGNLDKVEVGDTIDISYQDGMKQFKVAFIQIVSPDNVSVIKATNDTRITLFTCTGFLDSKRLVVSALQV